MAESSDTGKIILKTASKKMAPYFDNKFRYLNKEELITTFTKLMTIINVTGAELADNFPYKEKKAIAQYRLAKKMPLKSDMLNIFMYILGDYDNVLALAKAYSPEIYNLWIELGKELFINCAKLDDNLLSRMDGFKSGRYYHTDVISRNPLCLMMEFQSNNMIYYSHRNNIDMLKQCYLVFPRVYEQKLIEMMHKPKSLETGWMENSDIIEFDLEKEMPKVFSSMKLFAETNGAFDPSKKLTQAQLRKIAKFVPIPELPIVPLNILVEKWGVRIVETFFNIVAARQGFFQLSAEKGFKEFESLCADTNHYGTYYRQLEYLSFPYLNPLRTNTIDGPWILNVKRLFKDVLKKYGKREWVGIRQLDYDLTVATIESGYAPLDFFNDRRNDLIEMWNTIVDDYMLSNLGWQYLSYPYYLTLLCMYAQMGLVSLAIDNTIASRDTSNPYESIRAFRINDLGHAILNNLDYTPDFRSAQEDFKTEFDDDRHIVSLLSPSDPAILFVKRMGHEIAPGRFQITRKSMMQDIVKPDNLRSRCKEFLDYFKLWDNKNWADYIASIEEAATPVCKPSLERYRYYKISPDNKELMDLITRNETIRENCIPGYGYRLFVPENFEIQFREILRLHGFLI